MGLFQKKAEISEPLEVVRAVHVDNNLEWEFDQSVDPAMIFAKIRVIGKGGFGTVAQILHRPSMKVLAGKLVNEQLLDSDASKSELKNEIDLLRLVNSQYTVRYYGSVPLEGSLMILMEFCDRGSLRDLLDSRKQVLSEDQISIVMRDVLQGLKMIHQQHHILHRDIKAANILLNSNGEIKIADFGLSRKFESGSQQTIKFVGTPYWMAPEIISGVAYSYPADIWSVGITCVELCEGAPPFAEFPPTKAMIEITIKGFAGYRFPDMHSPEICDFISHCVETDPNKRWNVDQLLEHPFVKRAERLNRLETLDNLLKDPQKQPQNQDFQSSKNANTNTFEEPKNNGFNSFGVSNVSQAANLPTGHNFVKPQLGGASFEGMAMLMSQKGNFNSARNDDFSSNSFNAPLSDFASIESDTDPFNPSSRSGFSQDSGTFNSLQMPFEQVRGQNLDSFSGYNMPLSQNGTDSFTFDSFKPGSPNRPTDSFGFNSSINQNGADSFGFDSFRSDLDTKQSFENFNTNERNPTDSLVGFNMPILQSGLDSFKFEPYSPSKNDFDSFSLSQKRMPPHLQYLQNLQMQQQQSNQSKHVQFSQPVPAQPVPAKPIPAQPVPAQPVPPMTPNNPPQQSSQPIPSMSPSSDPIPSMSDQQTPYIATPTPAQFANFHAFQANLSNANQAENQYNYQPNRPMDANMSDQLFVNVSRTMSMKIPFVPFTAKQDDAQPLAPELPVPEEKVDEKIIEVREKLRKSPALTALIILLLFFFWYDGDSIIYLCGMLCSISILIRQIKYAKKVKKAQQLALQRQQSRMASTQNPSEQ